jgi:iron complex transport system substrate-binding protein
LGSVGFFVPLVLLLAAACGPRPASTPASRPVRITDDSGVPVSLPRPAARVISLVPSVTETIEALGATARLVGRTTNDHQASLAGVPVVGDGLRPGAERIVAQQPDLVILWSGDTRGDLRQQLTAAGIATAAFDVQDTADAMRSFAALGVLLGLAECAESLATAVRQSFAETARRQSGANRPRAFFLVYDDPPMTAGPSTFIDQLLGVAGADNIFHDAPTDWPVVALEEIVRRDPDVIVLPARSDKGAVERVTTRPGWRELRAVRQGRVHTIDADLATRPGPNMARAAQALAGLVGSAE